MRPLPNGGTLGGRQTLMPRLVWSARTTRSAKLRRSGLSNLDGCSARVSAQNSRRRSGNPRPNHWSRYVPPRLDPPRDAALLADSSLGARFIPTGITAGLLRRALWPVCPNRGAKRSGRRPLRSFSRTFRPLPGCACTDLRRTPADTPAAACEPLDPIYDSTICLCVGCPVAQVSLTSLWLRLTLYGTWHQATS
jgi:hypothetical protein